MSKKKYLDFIESAESSVEYWTETAITDFTEEVSRLMEKHSITRKELADKIGTSQAYITKVLRGNVNFTLATMTKIAIALNTVVRIHLAPSDTKVTWHEDAYAEDSSIELIFEPSIRYVSAKFDISTPKKPVFDVSSSSDFSTPIRDAITLPIASYW